MTPLSSFRGDHCTGNEQDRWEGVDRGRQLFVSSLVGLLLDLRHDRLFFKYVSYIGIDIIMYRCIQNDCTYVQISIQRVYVYTKRIQTYAYLYM